MNLKEFNKKINEILYNIKYSDEIEPIHSYEAGVSFIKDRLYYVGMKECTKWYFKRRLFNTLNEREGLSGNVISVLLKEDRLSKC